MGMSTTTTAPLQDYRIVGLRENWYQAAPEAPKQPGGSCWHCGTGIAIEVVIQQLATDEQHTIGTTCAERVGMDVTELKQWLADRYAEQRAEAKRQRSAEYRAARAEREAAETAAFGPHGTDTRFVSGCRCNPCVNAAPHGTLQRFWNNDCRCLDCLDVAMSQPDMTVREQTVIVDVETGEVADARVVETRYGSRWCVRDGSAWLPLSPKRRATQANKGYVEAAAAFLTEKISTRHGWWYKPVARLSDPIMDAWGETIVRAA